MITGKGDEYTKRIEIEEGWDTNLTVDKRFNKYVQLYVTYDDTWFAMNRQQAQELIQHLTQALQEDNAPST